VTTNSGFKVTVLFKGECLKKVHFKDKVTTGLQAIEWYQLR